ncbi:MAG: hypothetical protein HKP14_08090 [Bacteroidia bacterium]|nr:hypothetical protein [Bacteroidia bacterium]
MKKVDDGAVILSTKSTKNLLECTKISIAGDIVWKANVNVPNLNGYNFNKLVVIEGNDFLFVVNQLSKESLISKISKSNGDIVYENQSFKTETKSETNHWLASNDEIKLVKTSGGTLIQQQFNSESTSEIGNLPSIYSEDHYQVNFTKNNAAYASSYTLERNHGEMHIYLSKYDAELDSTIENTQDLTLDHTSYTYNSSYDKRVFGVKQDETGFYFMGKLDIQFKKDYPTVKNGDNFIGFWVAKFNYDLQLEYFIEMPFQYFQGIVPADVIKKPAVIDFKEDYNTGLLININELKGVIYGSKYIVYLDSLGIYRYAIGGHDDYNFMEYDNLGLRNAGRKLRIRMMNDDWAAYATNPILYLGHRKNDYSKALEESISLANSSKATNQNKAYNYLFFDDQIMYLEYLSKKKGTLNIFK